MLTKHLRAAIFIRVSTEDQDLTNQRFHLMELLKFRGYEYFKTYEYIQSAFTEVHHSNTDYLKDLREDARLGKFDVLLIWSLDRLSRRGIKHTLDIVSELSAHNVQIVSSKEAFIVSFTDPVIRQLFISLLAFVSKFESSMKSERIKATLERKKKQGLPVGKPKGAKDTKPRRKRGYLENKNALSKNATKEINEILDDEELPW